MVRQYIQVTDE